PQMHLDKNGAPTTYDSVGDQITYTYTLTNTSNVTWDGPFTITDDKATVTCPPPTPVPPGGSVTCSATYSVIQADLDAGQVVNHATGSPTFRGDTVLCSPVRLSL